MKRPKDRSEFTGASDTQHPATFLLSNNELFVTFMVARATAIEQYAMVEHSLARLFAYLMGTSQELASVPFFKMNNARARLIMLEQLLKKKHGSTYNIFWNSLVKHLRPIDDKRNSIVHWVVAQSLTRSNKPYYFLVGNNWPHVNQEADGIYRDDLYDYILQCYFFFNLIYNFHWVISGSPKKIDPSWPEICQQPIVYPPPEHHPLYRKPATR